MILTHNLIMLHANIIVLQADKNKSHIWCYRQFALKCIALMKRIPKSDYNRCFFLLFWIILIQNNKMLLEMLDKNVNRSMKCMAVIKLFMLQLRSESVYD